MVDEKQDAPEKDRKHPSFVLAEKLRDETELPSHIRNHFPTTSHEVRSWEPIRDHRALSRTVLVAMKTRVECAWAAYIGDVPGRDHDAEWQSILRIGTKLPEATARTLWPYMAKVPYAR